MQWQKIATEDLKQGGSLQVELKSPVFQAGKGSHHNFLTLTYRQLGNINIQHLVIIYCTSALCNAKITSSDLQNNL